MCILQTFCTTRALTPRHRLRQLDPSLLVSGHTTSLLASDVEKELVSEDRGGMARRIQAAWRGEDEAAHCTHLIGPTPFQFRSCMDRYILDINPDERRCGSIECGAIQLMPL